MCKETREKQFNVIFPGENRPQIYLKIVKRHQARLTEKRFTYNKTCYRKPRNLNVQKKLKYTFILGRSGPSRWRRYSWKSWSEGILNSKKVSIDQIFKEVLDTVLQLKLKSSIRDICRTLSNICDRAFSH